ncbi:erythromycin esterase family protein [bacterium LRH843]|nr:erythromycin esterase family protein [bacterium LRH843]
MNQSLIKTVKDYAIPFNLDDSLTTLIEEIGEAKIVLLGEASHGTSEFYSIRSALSKRLIKEKGFTIIAVEGDWPASQKVNRYIKGYEENAKDAKDAKDAKEVLNAFNRWPTWMWANEEIADLVEWLRLYNLGNTTEQKVGFYGIDIYSLWESMEEVLQYLSRTEQDGVDLELAKKAFSCFEPFNRNPENYAISSLHFSDVCVDEVAKLLTSIRSHEEHYPDDEEADLNLKVNALVTKNAEKYYRAMVQNDALSWNIRDEHMVETIHELLSYYGEDAKILIWEHNTHIGDASATDMKEAGMINVGQLMREQHQEEEVYAVGFGTYCGTVIAADRWGSPFEEIDVPPAQSGSFEDVLHQTGAFDKILFFTDQNRHLFDDCIGHRAIGVVYNPEYEAYGNYVPSKIGSRYDAFIYIDQTKALVPLETSNPLT